MHKHKTFATLLASVAGSTGVHRFYLYGKHDRWAWLYLGFLSVYAAWIAYATFTSQIASSVLAWFPLPVLVAFVEALVLGLTPDDKWDTRHNRSSLQQSNSGWPLVLVLVLTLAIGFVTMVSCLARATDLMYTGGSFG
jgi:hypothetical protein